MNLVQIILIKPVCTKVLCGMAIRLEMSKEPRTIQFQ